MLFGLNPATECRVFLFTFFRLLAFFSSTFPPPPAPPFFFFDPLFLNPAPSLSKPENNKQKNRRSRSFAGQR